MTTPAFTSNFKATGLWGAKAVKASAHSQSPAKPTKKRELDLDIEFGSSNDAKKQKLNKKPVESTLTSVSKPKPTQTPAKSPSKPKVSENVQAKTHDPVKSPMKSKAVESIVIADDKSSDSNKDAAKPQSAVEKINKLQVNVSQEFDPPIIVESGTTQLPDATEDKSMKPPKTPKLTGQTSPHHLSPHSASRAAINKASPSKASFGNKQIKKFSALGGIKPMKPLSSLPKASTPLSATDSSRDEAMKQVVHSDEFGVVSKRFSEAMADVFMCFKNQASTSGKNVNIEALDKQMQSQNADLALEIEKLKIRLHETVGVNYANQERGDMFEKRCVQLQIHINTVQQQLDTERAQRKELETKMEICFKDLKVQIKQDIEATNKQVEQNHQEIANWIEQQVEQQPTDA